MFYEIWMVFLWKKEIFREISRMVKICQWKGQTVNLIQVFMKKVVKQMMKKGIKNIKIKLIFFLQRELVSWQRVLIKLNNQIKLLIKVEVFKKFSVSILV